MIGLGVAVARGQVADPFAFLSPTIQVSQADRQRLARGETIVNILPSRGHDLAVLAVTPTSMSPERLVQWSSDIERLKGAPPVHQVKRLSANPGLDEFESLTLPEEDLRDFRNCRPGDCDVKLTRDEMNRLRAAMRAQGAQWMAAASQTFREIARDRILTYIRDGHAGLAPYADGRGEPSRAAAFADVLANSPFLAHTPALLNVLQGPPRAVPGIQSSLYWSVEEFGAKTVASATQTIIMTPADPRAPSVIVAGKQIFATHYSSASLNVIALVHGTGTGNGESPRYLIIVNRSAIDALGGFFGGITRRVIEGRVRRETGDLIESFKHRIEAGPPR